MNPILKNELEKAFRELGLEGKHVEVHSSLSSFGKVTGGAKTFIDALMKVANTSIYPAFFEQAHILPTDYAKYKRNGLHLELIPRNEWLGTEFHKSSPIDKDMGIIPRTILEEYAYDRSAYPTRSWIGVGSKSKEILEDHILGRLHAPLEKLVNLDGYILLAGVTLERCTAIHLAEELAGRKHFVRWVRIQNKIVDCLEGGDSDGFDNLLPLIEKIEKKIVVGKAVLRVYRMQEFLDIVVKELKQNPEITRCSETCPVCADTISGGPYIE